MNKFILGIGILWLSCSATAQDGKSAIGSKGAGNGQPFLELQEALGAANDALAAAVSANTSNIAANAAAIDAETAAREAEDFALMAKFAAELALEVLARIEGDNNLAEALASEVEDRKESLDILGTRIAALEAGAGSLPPVREATYEETEDLDFTGLRDDIFALDYQQGEWLYMASTFAPTGETSAICTAHDNAYNVIVAYATNGALLVSVAGPSTFILEEGSDSWVIPLNATMQAQPIFLLASGPGMNATLVDRTTMPWSLDSELITFSGPALGSTAVLRASADRLTACGF